MKKRLVIMLAALLATFALATAIALAYGNNFSFPAARRIVISQGYSDTHQAYDYSFTTHTAVAAAKAGTVTASRFDRVDGYDSHCTGGIEDRGNYIVLDHGAGLETWYFHLSNTGSTPGVGTYFYRGAPMALSDDTGCSDNPHLHFATKLNGTPFDPYAGTTDWVSGAPIPMGYRNQDGTTNGPYALDRTKIHDKWLALEGKPGSPLEDDWTYICYIQTFEQGRISDCGGASATYVEFAKTYLPDIRARYSIDRGLNSSIVVRNNSPGSAIVNITIYKSDGAVLDTRTYKALGAGAIWTLNVWDVVFDTSLGYPTGIFEGSAVVAADQDVSVVVTNQRSPAPYSSGAYVGLSSARTSSTFYLPLVMRRVNGASGLSSSQIVIQNAGASAITVNVDLFRDPASPGGNYNKTFNLSPNAAYLYDLSGDTAIPSGWYGSAKVSVGGGNKLAVTSNLLSGSDMLQTYNAFPAESLGTAWSVPLFASRLTNGLNTPVAVQNLSSTTIPVGGVTLSCTPDPGSSGSTNFSKQNTTAISPNAAYYFNPVTDLTIPTNWYGSCRVTASQNVVSFVQMRFVGAGNTASAAAYEALRTNGTDRQAIFPRVERQPNGTTLATAVTIQNLSASSDATVTLNYYRSAACAGPDYLSIRFTILAGQSLIRNHRIGDDLPVGWCGSLLVTSSNQPIHGFIQLTDLNSPLGAGDTLMAHNATTRP